jgi:hypothetical protein
MVFHRFISEDGVSIALGQGAVPAWDPFLPELSKRLPEETLHLNGQQILVVPWALPHHSRLTDDQHRDAGGSLGWNKHQGFFVYRCRRLIVPGDWLNLNLRQEEHYKLARIQIDLPNTMDEEWHLNVVKSHVAAPAILRDDLKRIAADVRKQASEIYRVRGERAAPTDPGPNNPVWRREESKKGVRFLLNLKHPAIASLLHSGCEHDAALAAVLRTIELSVPIAAMLQEPQKALDGAPVALTDKDLESLLVLARHTEHHLCRLGNSLEEARTTVLGSEPFVRFRDLLLPQLSTG